MSIFKCKMCGGTLEVNNNETVGVCEYCGTKQTLPKLDNERKMNLYDRANHFRRNNEFDKAMGIYEQILNEDSSDAESYWSIVLCRYGIEYVEDPTSRRRIPTVNRAQFTSIFDDADYKSALQYADGYQREIYESEATAINEIQKGILAISQKEEPFDVFICYKETDKNGRRTQDSVLAQELYYELLEEGFKVFFAKITLEDKLGQEYEPYIFAALNSAKVMVVLGTKPEHFNAVWVKNEWSRYLALIKKGENKMLIPAYRDMDPYDLPEEFSHLQAQDMSKLGFIQDLVRGIKKIVDSDELLQVANEKVDENIRVATVETLLERAFIFLEDGDWSSANEYCEKVLDASPRNAHAYLGKLMAEMCVHKKEHLADLSEPFEQSTNYQRAIKYADEQLKILLEDYEQSAKYNCYVIKMKNAQSSAEYSRVCALLKTLGDYKDAVELSSVCHEKEQEFLQYENKDNIYKKALEKMNSIENHPDAPAKYVEVAMTFDTISDWKDSEQMAVKCRQMAKETEEKMKKWVEQQVIKLHNQKVSKVTWAIEIVLFFSSLIVYNKMYFWGEEMTMFIICWGFVVLLSATAAYNALSNPYTNASARTGWALVSRAVGVIGAIMLIDAGSKIYNEGWNEIYFLFFSIGLMFFVPFVTLFFKKRNNSIQ